MAQEIAVAEAAVAVFGEGGVVRHPALDATEPAIGEVEVHLLARRRSERTPERQPMISMRIINSGSTEGRPAVL